MTTVTVFGLGFVGLTTGLGFADLGYTVYGLDIDVDRKNMLRSGKIPFAEPFMQDVLKKYINKNFFVEDDSTKAVRESDFIFYCVGTPYGENGSANLTYLFSAIDSTISSILGSNGMVFDDKFRVIITKSTIPPSTTADKIVPYIKSKGKVSDNIGVANNPEFLREGHCWEDFKGADRIVIGCDCEKTRERMEILYASMKLPMFFVSHSTAEFVKYLSNTMLATLISYSNEMAQVADAIGGIDVPKAFKILHMDKRWGNCDMVTYVYPGCGYGGYCLPKDTCALFAQSKVKGFEPTILREVIHTNENRPKTVADMISKNLNKRAVIGILGLSFKPGSDDVRDTPALKIIEELYSKGYGQINAYDPISNEEFKVKYPNLKIKYFDSMNELYVSSDVIAITTAWDEFKIVKELGEKRIIDCRYMLE